MWAGNRTLRQPGQSVNADVQERLAGAERGLRQFGQCVVFLPGGESFAANQKIRPNKFSCSLCVRMIIQPLDEIQEPISLFRLVL
jgi:hypothetical protein